MKRSSTGTGGLLVILALALLGPSPLRAEALSDKESFMLMFGKGNGAMRVLCALQQDGLLDPATRKRWVTRLETLLMESGDTALDRRNTRLGMAFADRRPSLCPERVMGQADP